MARDVVQMVLELSDKATPALKRVGREMKDTTEKAKDLKISLGAVGTALKIGAAAMTAASAGFAAIGVGAVKAGSEMEGFQTRLTVLMGSAGEAKGRLDELFRIGSTTPFELPGLIEAEVNLRALGVNAEKTLPMVMDFAGAMGVDLASAAVEVGRAMQFGAGAVETISGRALRAQVELRTGADALKMSTSEFREAMVETLTDPDGIFAGGTEKLAATFDGMLSNLSDAFFKFSKDVGEAGLFDVAKETLREVLALIGNNADGVKVLATVVSEGLGKALLGSVKLMGKMFDIALAIGAAFIDIGRAWSKTIIGIGEAANVIGLGPSDEEMSALRERLRTLDMTKDALLDMGGAATAAEDMVARIEANVAKVQKVQAVTPTGAPVSAAKPAAAEVDIKRRAEAQKALEARQEAFDSAADSFASSMDRVRSAMMGPQKRSQRMQSSLNALAESFRAAHLKAVELGNTSSEQFLKMAEDFEATSQRMGAAIQQQRRVEGLQTGAQALQAAGGGAGGLLSFAGAAAGPGSVAGPIVGAIQGLGALGQMGAEKFREDLKEFINNVITGLVEVLPEIIGEVPLALIDALPELILGTLQALPKILARLFITLPISIAKGAGLALREIWETMKKWLANALEKISPKGIVKGIGSGFKKLGKSIGSVFGFQTGGYVRNSGLHMLHAGERIIPTSGASTQAVMAGAENIGSGQAVTINTSVVDPNAIDGLARMLQRELGSFGGGRDLSIFNTPAASAG